MAMQSGLLTVLAGDECSSGVTSGSVEEAVVFVCASTMRTF
ncbi:MAG: hypothetical protein CFH37_00731 [Alphaproteobacteria bacterium MarineAlpha9_Bin7]|nr:MAG: hypothetical protein CFH37_00731 [Alphaproteobacteria bacterium MarineAlpha9_Bin7]